MTKKIAITIAGAVSLGSYEAGVLYEVFRSIQHHNEHEPNIKNKIVIDVLTGASAGGMTAAIAAQKLLFEATSLQEPYNNSLYRAWVKDVAFDVLFNLQKDESPTQSILSSNAIEGISQKHLKNRYANLPSHPPTITKHNSIGEDGIHIGLALSNLNGIDYERTITTGGSITYTRYQDNLTRKLENTDDVPEIWEVIRNAAVSCGAFPFAFRVKNLTRHYKEYLPSAYLPAIPKGSFPTEDRIFTYTDGGTFENEPLGLAKNLVDNIDPTHLHNDARYYLFIAPSARIGTSNSQFNANNANLLSTGKTITSAIFNQARFHDWIKAEKINESIQLLDKRAEQLAKQIIDGNIQYAELQNASSHLSFLLIPDNNEKNAAISRLKIQYNSTYLLLSKKCNIDTANIWLESVLVLETAADLGDRDEMKILGITASDSDLAGGGVFAFLGFLDQAYRDHDYDVGRKKAREFVLNNQLLFPYFPKGSNKTNYEEWMIIREVDIKLDNLTLNKVPEEIREKFKDRLLDRIDEILKELGLSWLVREGIENIKIKPLLNKFLGL